MRQIFLKDRPAKGVDDFFKKLQMNDAVRLRAAMQRLSHLELHSPLAVPLGEIMNFPDVLADAQLNEALTKAIKGLKEGELLAGVSPEHRAPAGVYWLLMHRDTSVRSWAQGTVTRCGPSIETMAHFQTVQPVLENCLRVLEYDDFQDAPKRAEDTVSGGASRYRPSRSEFWTGLHKLLGMIEAEPFEEGLMAQFPSFLDLVLNQIDTSVAWQTIRCLRVFFERLGGKVWHGATFTPRFVKNSLVGCVFRPQGLKAELVHKCVLEALPPLIASLGDYETAEAGEGSFQVLKAEIADFVLIQLQKCNTVSVTIKAVGAQIGLQLTGESFEADSPTRLWNMLPPCSHVVARMLGVNADERHSNAILTPF